MRDHYYDRKKNYRKQKIQSSVWRVRDHYYDWKKKVLVVCLAGARSLLQPEKKIQSSVWRVRYRNYDRKKQVLVVCLAGCAVVSVFGSGGK